MRFHTSILILSLLHIARSGNICYYPNGETMGTDVPCDPDAPFTQCCPSRDTCLTNGLCALDFTEDDSGISYARGTCTDKSWASPLCPQQCQLNQNTPTNSSAYDFRGGGVQMWQCGTQGYGVRAEYCCESEREKQACCETDTVVFVLESATIGAYTGVDSTLSLSSSTSSTVLDAATTPSRTGSMTQISNSPTANAPVDATNNSNNKSITIGAGVGGALGGCLLTAVLVFLIRRYRRRAPHQSEPPISVPGFDNKTMLELPTQEPQLELTSQSQPVWELPTEQRVPGHSTNGRRF